jgi:hypothetical protein
VALSITHETLTRLVCDLIRIDAQSQIRMMTFAQASFTFNKAKTVR